jgi:hypothetical protein
MKPGTVTKQKPQNKPLLALFNTALTILGFRPALPVLRQTSRSIFSPTDLSGQTSPRYNLSTSPKQSPPGTGARGLS